MASLLASLIAESLKLTPEELRKRTEAQKQLLQDKADGVFRKRKNLPVQPSAEFRRIEALPRRPWNLHQQNEYIDAATDVLRTPKGNMRLRDVQAAALIEAQRVEEKTGRGGLVALMGTGSGKSLTSYLLPIVLNSSQTVLLVPPSLVEQTNRQWLRMGQHFQIAGYAPRFHVVSYSTLHSTKPEKQKILETLKPDLIIADEAHNLKNKSSTQTKRVMRYLNTHPFVRLCVMSGTLTTRSLKDYQHLVQRAIGGLSPVPEDWNTLMEWCACLDSDIHEEDRKPPGVLEKFCYKVTRKKTDSSGAKYDFEEFESAREGFRRRLVSTLGVVATTESFIGTALEFYNRPLSLPAEVKKAIKDLRDKWAFPDGEEFSDVLELAAAERELSCGFWNKWIWPKDADGNPIVDHEWLEARTNWNRAVRERLKHAGPGMDSPLLLFNAAARGDWKTPEFEPWKKVHDRPAPPTEAQWVDDSFLIDDAIAWGKAESGIIWYSHVAVGEAIASRGGFPFYGGGKKASAEILDEKGDRTIVASMQAHGEGKNLQEAFSRNLFTTPPASGKIWEQTVSRTHREGQKEDSVTVEIYLHTSSFVGAFRQALADSKYIEQTTGNRQKLCYGTFVFDTYEDVPPEKGD